MKLIDADALIDKYQREIGVDLYRYNVIQDLVNAPTVDAVPVIRCRDCIYKNEYGRCTFYINFHHWTDDMAYCSDGERRDKRNG